MTAKQRIGLYPGTFDPVTLGHLDIIKRAVKLVDHLVIGVATNARPRRRLFTLAERVEMLRHEAAPLAGDRPRHHRGGSLRHALLVQFAPKRSAPASSCGACAPFPISNMNSRWSAMNQRLNTEIETVFLMADPRHQAIASRLVKEIAMLGGDVTAFTTPHVAGAADKTLQERQNQNARIRFISN